VIPLSVGGTNWPANLRPACRSCNSAKGASSDREAVG
jgi:5-methylcytosine-specific restriction endonuclease McrA